MYTDTSKGKIINVNYNLDWTTPQRDEVPKCTRNYFSTTQPIDDSFPSPSNCDNKTTNPCNSGNFYGNLCDESLNQINGANKSKSARKRNINMLKLLNDGENSELCHNIEAKKVRLDETDSGNKDQIYQVYQPWVLKAYGDQAKTKTITLKKQARIVCALKGLESSRPDSSKFRFWVRSKGFITDLTNELKTKQKHQEIWEDGCILYVPSKTESSCVLFKKVAVVEHFFNIIYKVHCSVGSGRHVGQKRTYRKITESYAFLPREAVTKFLAHCFDCRKASKTFFLQEITEEASESDNDKNREVSTYNTFNIKQVKSNAKDNQSALCSDYSQIINSENYYGLLKALYENTLAGKGETGNVAEQSSDKHLEAFKENITSNTINNNEASNHCNQEIYRKNTNIKIKQESESSSSAINSLDIVPLSTDQIKFPARTSTPKHFETLQKFGKIEKSVNDEILQQSNQQLDVVSSSSVDDIEFCNETGQRPDQPKNKNYLKIRSAYGLPTNNVQAARAVYGRRERDKLRSQEVPDDYYHNIKNIKNYGEAGGSNLIAYQGAETTAGPAKTHKNSSNDIKPITSTYLMIARSMGVSDQDALDLDSISTSSESHAELANLDDSYANMFKDADKLKLMLLAWNYQNSTAVRNGSTGPDLATMTNLWEQYQNALANNTKSASNDHQDSPSPQSHSQDDLNSPSDLTKEEDDDDEDELEDRIEMTTRDPERLKAFNMFVRLFVDENLDRMIPISKQPKEKVQAIIDSCSRQFPDFSERARKRLRTYLKSCRRNKKTKDGWENLPSRPTPAHLTSIQAEQMLAIACENESLNAKRMRVGLEPISQSLTIPSSISTETSLTPLLYTTAKTLDSITTPLSISTGISNCKTSPMISTTTDSNANALNVLLNNNRDPLPINPYNPDFTNSFGNKNNVTNTNYYNGSLTSSTQVSGATDLTVKRPLLPHKLNLDETSAVKQLVTGYRESAAFLLRSADELEQLLLNQQP